jgi:hypothetical protein
MSGIGCAHPITQTSYAQGDVQGGPRRFEVDGIVQTVKFLLRHVPPIDTHLACPAKEAALCLSMPLCDGADR